MNSKMLSAIVVILGAVNPLLSSANEFERFERAVKRAADDIGELGQGGIDIVRDAGQRTSNSMAKFLHNPIEYAIGLPEKLFTEACAAPANVFRLSFAYDASRWKSLPPEIIRDAQRFYSTDLTSVVYSENVSTNGPEAVTLGKAIYVSHGIDWNNPNHQWLMFHELEHTEHYKGETRATKLCEYSLKALGTGMQHDRIDWERAADSKANFVMANIRDLSSGPSMAAPRNWPAAPPPPVRNSHVTFRNDVNAEVVFGVQVPGYHWAQIRLMPGQIYTFETPNPNSPFNIAIDSHGQVIAYTVPDRTFQAINVNPRGMLDFFRLQ